MKMETFEHFLTVGKSNNFVRGKICHVKITNLSLNEHIGCRKRSLQTKDLQCESLRNDPFCRKWISSNSFRSELLLTRISSDFKNPCRQESLLALPLNPWIHICRDSFWRDLIWRDTFWQLTQILSQCALFKLGKYFGAKCQQHEINMGQ